MSGITGMGTTFNLPNFHGQLIAMTPQDTPFLSAIGGLTPGGGGMTVDTEFEWQGYDLREPGQNVALEGAAAPTGQARVRTNFSNVCEIHHEKVSVSYTKLAATGQYAGVNAGGAGNPDNPVTNESDFQLKVALAEIGLDVNHSFLNGEYSKPTDNTKPRKTRGVINAAATKVFKGTNVATGATADAATDSITPTAAHSLSVGNPVVFTAVGDTGLTTGKVYYVQAVSTTVSFKVAATSGGTLIQLNDSAANVAYHSIGATALDVDTIINPFVQSVYDAGGLRGGTGTFVVGSTQKIALTKAYATAYAKANPLTSGEKIGGVAIDQIQTDFGIINIMLDIRVPKDGILLATLGECRPVFLNTPGKGVFFEEPLAKVGSSDDTQIYGEIGLDYGNTASHGYLAGLPIS